MTKPIPPLLAILALAALAVPVAAHVHTGVTEARPGERVEIALEIGHGCAGKPTTGLRVAIPPGLEKVEALPAEGWQTAVSPTEVSWSGGTLGDHDKGRFALAATVSGDATGQIVLPIIQVCGDETLRWIDPDPAADNPAPSIRVLPAQ